MSGWSPEVLDQTPHPLLGHYHFSSVCRSTRGEAIGAEGYAGCVRNGSAAAAAAVSSAFFRGNLLPACRSLSGHGQHRYSARTDRVVYRRENAREQVCCCLRGSRQEEAGR